MLTWQHNGKAYYGFTKFVSQDQLNDDVGLAITFVNGVMEAWLIDRVIGDTDLGVFYQDRGLPEPIFALCSFVKAQNECARSS